MLEACELSVQLGSRKLLDAVSFSVRAGETVAVLGENGAGKTTLLRALAGDRLASRSQVAGEVRLAGRPVSAWSLSERARLRAVLPQRPEAAFAFTVREVTALGRYAGDSGWLRASDRTIADAALRLVDAYHLADVQVAQLSGGEQARVYLAAAFAQLWESKHEFPRFLLLDEPTAALDLAHQHQLLANARTFARERNMGIVAILHDLNLAAMYADRVVVLRSGRVLAQGAPGVVLQPEIIGNGFAVDACVLVHPLADVPLIATAGRQVAAGHG